MTMDLKDTCTLLLDKGTQRVKCFKFKSKELNRELALHENVDNKAISTVTDVKTGMVMFNIRAQFSKINESCLLEELNKFIKHFTLSYILERVNELDQTSMEDKLNKGKKK